jgi:hypothetical protein
VIFPTAFPGYFVMDTHEGREFSEDSEKGMNQSPSLPSFSVPAGFKLVPVNYVAVEPTMYDIMLNALKQPVQTPVREQAPIQVQVNGPKEEEPKPYFLVRMLQQCHFGDIGYNVVRGQEIEYSPEGKYLKIDGETFTSLRSFLEMWKLQYGPAHQRSAEIVRNPFFEILNSDNCPPLEESLGRTLRRGQLTPDPRRVSREEARSDATRPVRPSGEREVYPGIYGAPEPSARDLEYDPHEREHASRGLRNQRMQQQMQMESTHRQIIQPAYPQQSMQQQMSSQYPTMPPRSGVRGPDGLTDRGRLIKNMSADQVERPVQRQTVQPVAGYDAPERVEDFMVEPGMVAGGQTVSMIPGDPADEALVKSREMDARVQQLQGGRIRY